MMSCNSQWSDLFVLLTNKKEISKEQENSPINSKFN